MEGIFIGDGGVSSLVVGYLHWWGYLHLCAETDDGMSLFLRLLRAVTRLGLLRLRSDEV